MAGDRHVRFDDEADKQILAISNKTGDSVAETIRKLVNKGLAVTWNEENTDMLAKMIRDSVDVVMKVHVERLAALSSKTLHMAATSTFLNVQSLQDLVPPERRKDIKPMYDTARKMAVEYAKTKPEEWKINE